MKALTVTPIAGHGDTVRRKTSNTTDGTFNLAPGARLP